MPVFIQQPEPSNVGEPQSVRDAWDKQLQAQAEADRALREAVGEIEMD